MTAERCLHHVLIDDIHRFYRARGAVNADDRVIVDSLETLDHLAVVAAAIISACPDMALRKRLMKDLARDIAAHVPALIAAGRKPSGIITRSGNA